MNKTNTIKIIGSGIYLPARPLLNNQIEEIFGIKEEWINTQLGISCRYSARDNISGKLTEYNSDMATKAALAAIQDAGIDKMEIDLIIMSTITPDHPIPATVNIVQEKLGLNHLTCLEFRAGCSGSVQSIGTAFQYLTGEDYQTALVIGSELISSYYIFDKSIFTKQKDILLSTALFGDGAGALILKKDSTSKGLLIHGWLNRSGGSGQNPGFYQPAGGSRKPFSEEVLKEGSYIFAQDYIAIYKNVPRLTKEAYYQILKKVGWGNVDYLLPPQPSGRLIKRISQAVKVPEERLFSVVDRVANTGSAALYLQIDFLKREKKLKPNDTIVAVTVEATKWLYGALALQYA